MKKLASSYLLCIGSQSLEKLAPSDGEIFGDEIRGESTKLATLYGGDGVDGVVGRYLAFGY